MTSLVLASLSVAVPMGQQVYEERVAAGASDRLGPAWQVRRTVVRTLRSPLPGTVRVPSRVLTVAPAAVRRAVGAVLYRGSDVVHRLDLRVPPAPAPEILTVHDVVSWRFDDEASPPAAAVAEARRAEVVICPSQFSADEVASVLGVRNPVAIPNGVGDEFFAAAPLGEEELAALGIRRPFVLHAGGCSRRKNLAALAAAWPAVHRARPAACLVLVGPPDPRRDELFAPLAGTVRAGRVPSVAPLMAAASAVVVPSLYEGFGIPAAEAMAVGAPVVATRRSALPEVCGDDAVMVEPSPEGITEGLLAALDGGSDISAMVARARIRARAFTWEASLQAHVAVWSRFAR